MPIGHDRMSVGEQTEIPIKVQTGLKDDEVSKEGTYGVWEI